MTLAITGEPGPLGDGVDFLAVHPEQGSVLVAERQVVTGSSTAYVSGSPVRIGSRRGRLVAAPPNATGDHNRADAMSLQVVGFQRSGRIG